MLGHMHRRSFSRSLSGRDLVSPFGPGKTGAGDSGAFDSRFAGGRFYFLSQASVKANSFDHFFTFQGCGLTDLAVVYTMTANKAIRNRHLFIEMENLWQVH